MNSSGVTFSVSCSVCGRTVPEGEDMMNPIGDPNWYCIDCWKEKQQKERQATSDQILADNDLVKYYLMRAHCDVCNAKTWHFYYIQIFVWDVIGMRKPIEHCEEKSECIEHSWADDYDRYISQYLTFQEVQDLSLVKTLKEGQSFSFELQYDPNSPFIKWARDMILQQDPEEEKEEIKLYE